MTVKEKLLHILEQSGGQSLSGQELANKLGVSRTAVWKAMNSLSQEGYEIEADKATGYRLIRSGDLLSAEVIRAYLPEELKSNHITVLKTVDSTNNYAKKAAADGAANGTMIAADTQTAGRGRRGNSFYSPAGTGLYMTVILRHDFFNEDTDLITICAGCAVCMAIEALTDKAPLIKWVNDIFLDGKKICGILSEATFDFEAKTMDSVVVGIGLNLTTDVFPDGLEKKAGTLGLSLNRSMLAAKIAECLFLCLKRTREENIADYKAHSLVLGKQVTFTKNGISYTADALDIDIQGQLIVRSEKGEMTLNSGEISVRL